MVNTSGIIRIIACALAGILLLVALHQTHGGSLRRKSRQPRYIFVDLGANRADSLETFLQNEGAKFEYDFPHPEWATHSQADIYLFEANPHFNTALLEAKAKYLAQGINVEIFPSTVVDVKDGTRTFYIDTVNGDHDYWGSSTYSNHPDAIKSNSKGTELSAINISRWLLMNTLPEDYVVVKMDIEGAEYDVVPHMVEMNAWSVVDHLIVEWHGAVADEAANHRANAAIAKLTEKGVHMPFYDSPA